MHCRPLYERSYAGAIERTKRMRTLRWAQGAGVGGERISPPPAYASATFDTMTPRPDYRQLLWYTLSTVMLATLTILLIVSFL